MTTISIRNPEMPRFLISKSPIIDQNTVISGTDYKHIVKVLRLRLGSEITLFDEDSFEHIGVITHVGTKDIKVKIKESRLVTRESRLSITLLQGLPKGDKMDLIVEKATELGVNTIVPVTTERSQVKNTRRLKRWQRIALESSKQCGRINPPSVEEVKELISAINLYKNRCLRLIFYENAEVNLRNYVRNINEPPITIVLFIGPEGGFSEKEVDLAMKCDFIPLSLGPRIFRTETAGIVAVSILQYLFGDL